MGGNFASWPLQGVGEVKGKPAETPWCSCGYHQIRSNKDVLQMVTIKIWCSCGYPIFFAINMCNISNDNWWPHDLAPGHQGVKSPAVAIDRHIPPSVRSCWCQYFFVNYQTHEDPCQSHTTKHTTVNYIETITCSKCSISNINMLTANGWWFGDGSKPMDLSWIYHPWGNHHSPSIHQPFTGHQSKAFTLRLTPARWQGDWGVPSLDKFNLKRSQHITLDSNKHYT